MYLKRIELQGFKSFAEKTTIEVHEGVTCIVGPNGSGKSNISDALRWVMGEQSAKSLRSGKMEDVIFNGTQKRKPLSFAEVTLVLDNESHFFRSDYTELAVTRRVFRSGESEYLINGAECRLKDVHELFMDTGLGREGYSIVGQGRIDEIISAKGEDRRQVFEEAAGISKYRHRKTEAERKLERTEENLVRVRDILSELESRVEPLRKQSEKARKYLDLREELKGIEVTSSVDIIDKNKAELEKNEELIKTAQSGFEREKKRLSDSEKESEALYAAMRESDEKTSAIRDEMDRERSVLSEKNAEKAALLNGVESSERAIAQAARDREANDRAMESDRVEEEKIGSERERLEEALKKERELLSGLEGAGSEISREMDEKGRAVEAVRQRIRDAERRLTESEQSAKSIDMLKASISTRQTDIDRGIASSNDSIERLEREREETEAVLSEIRKEKAARESEWKKTNDLAEEKARASELRKDEFNRISSSLGEKQGRLRMLEEMERSLEGYQRSVRDLMTAHKNGRYHGKITGILSKLITVPKEYSVAVEVALGGAMQNIVVPTEEDAKEAVSFLKKERMGRVTFLPLTAQEKRRLDGEARILSERGVIGVAADLVEREEYLNNTVEALLGRVIVTDNQDSAIRLARAYKYKFKIVTLTGEEFRTGGSITGGSMNRAVSVLGRAEEIESLKKEVRSLQKDAGRAEDDIDSLTDEARLLSRKRETLRLTLSDTEVKITRLEAELKALGERVDEEKERKTALEKEKDDISYKMLNNSELKREYALAAEKAKAEIELANSELEARQRELSEAMEKKDKSSDSVFKKRLAVSGMEKDISLACERLRMARERIETLKAQNEEKARAADTEKKNIESMRAQILKKDAEIKSSEEKISELEEKIKAEASGKSGTDQRAALLREEIRRMNDTVYALQSETARLESAKSKLEYNVENAVNKLWDEYEMTYTAAKENYKPGLAVSEAKKRIASLRSAIKALGNVNVDSVEEYREVKERYDFLSGQVTDLDEAKAGLVKLIDEITVVMRDIFDKKFKEINTYFGEIFKELFGGGQASVSLSDKANILESGIEIEVQPPGKKLQSISPLSGGEKALTAIALLFALMKVSPSPFVVLDEIEAALDDINVYRFADYMKKRTEHTQFVVITHRRGTMESADVLYGVTMQEKGVSKLLSMKLEDVREYEEQ